MKRFTEPTAPTFNRCQAARIVGVSNTWLKYLEKKGIIPPPSTVVGKRNHYSEAEVEQIKLTLDGQRQRQAELDKMYSKAEVCEILNVKPVVFQWHLEHSCFPAPLKTSTRCLYTGEEVDQIKRYFESRKMANKTLVLFQKYFREIGGNVAELEYTRRHKLMPEPAVVLPGDSLRTKYYRKQDIQKTLKKVRVLRGK